MPSRDGDKDGMRVGGQQHRVGLPRLPLTIALVSRVLACLNAAARSNRARVDVL